MITREFGAWIKRIDRTDVNTEIVVELAYDPDTDPFAVRATFTSEGEEPRVWLFGRKLLVYGSHALTPYGEGDVRFRYDSARGWLVMCLHSGGHGPEQATHADVALPPREVARFLEESAEVARASEEKVGALLDGFLQEVFGA